MSTVGTAVVAVVGRVVSGAAVAVDVTVVSTEPPGEQAARKTANPTAAKKREGQLTRMEPTVLRICPDAIDRRHEKKGTADAVPFLRMAFATT